MAKKGGGGNSHQRKVAGDADRLSVQEVSLGKAYQPSNEGRQLVLALVLAFVFGVVPMPAISKWLLWLLCWIGVVFILSSTQLAKKMKVRTRLLIAVCMTTIFPVALFSTARRQWQIEGSEKNSGDITSPYIEIPKNRPAIKKGEFFNPLVYVGASWECLCRGITQTDPKTHSLLNNADSTLYIWEEDHRYHVSTQVRDEQGRLILEMIDNHWTTSPDKSVSWDKNSNSNSLEVLDGKGLVVFQIVLLPEDIRVQGYWRDIHHGRTRIVQQPVDLKQSVWDLPDLDVKIFPIFRYPSADHWQELSPDQPPVAYPPR